MITISYQDLILTVIALSLVGMAGAVAWAAYRAVRLMRQYETLAPRVERLSIHADEFLDHLADVTEEFGKIAGRASVAGGNGATPRSDQVDAALSLVRQLSAVGIGIKSAVDAYQQKRPG